MVITKEISIDRFEPWAGAIPRFAACERLGILDIIEDILTECYPDGIDETELNDFFWFDVEDYIAEACDLVDDWMDYPNINDARKPQTEEEDE